MQNLVTGSAGDRVGVDDVRSLIVERLEQLIGLLSGDKGFRFQMLDLFNRLIERFCKATSHFGFELGTRPLGIHMADHFRHQTADRSEPVDSCPQTKYIAVTLGQGDTSQSPDICEILFDAGQFSFLCWVVGKDASLPKAEQSVARKLFGSSPKFVASSRVWSMFRLRPFRCEA